MTLEDVWAVFLDCGQTIIVSGPVLAVKVIVNALMSREAGEGPIRGRGG